MIYIWDIQFRVPPGLPGGLFWRPVGSGGPPDTVGPPAASGPPAAGGGATKTLTWGGAGTGTQIGGSQESKMPLVNVIQPFASRRLAWLYPGATAGSGGERNLSVAAALRRWPLRR